LDTIAAAAAGSAGPAVAAGGVASRWGGDVAAIAATTVIAAIAHLARIVCRRPSSPTGTGALVLDATTPALTLITTLSS
jgi:hypothetical protein